LGTRAVDTVVWEKITFWGKVPDMIGRGGFQGRSEEKLVGHRGQRGGEAGKKSMRPSATKPVKSSGERPCKKMCYIKKKENESIAHEVNEGGRGTEGERKVRRASIA